MIALFQNSLDIPTNWPAWAVGIVAVISAFSFGGGLKAVELWLKTRVEMKRIEAKAKADNYDKLITEVHELKDEVHKARETEMALIAEVSALKVEVKLLMERNKMLMVFIQTHIKDIDTSLLELPNDAEEAVG